MSIWEAIIQGLIQAATEFLPISSSGHLALFNYLSGSDSGGETLFTILLHMGTLIAVVFAYHKIIWEIILEAISLVKDIFAKRFKWSEMGPQRRLLMMLIIAMLPLLVMVPFSSAVNAVGKNIFLLGACFIFSGVILLVGHSAGKKKKYKEKITTGDALTVGILQGVAILPGVTRSGSTISAGLFSGMKKQTAMQFSFILSVPTILASFVLELIQSRDQLGTLEAMPVIVGILVSAVFGFVAIKLLQLIIKKNRFNVFAYYCFGVGAFAILNGLYELSVGENLIKSLFS